MRAQDRLAALKALQHGIAEAITRAQADVEQVREQTGAKSFDTELGAVTVAVSKPRLILPDDALIAWAEANGLDHEIETVKRARPSLRKTLAERFVIEDGTVIDTATGEQVEWAQIGEGSETVRVRLTDQAKWQAVELAADRLPELLEDS